MSATALLKKLLRGGRRRTKLAMKISLCSPRLSPYLNCLTRDQFFKSRLGLMECSRLSTQLGWEPNSELVTSYEAEDEQRTH